MDNFQQQRNQNLAKVAQKEQRKRNRFMGQSVPNFSKSMGTIASISKIEGSSFPLHPSNRPLEQNIKSSFIPQSSNRSPEQNMHSKFIPRVNIKYGFPATFYDQKSSMTQVKNLRKEMNGIQKLNLIFVRFIYNSIFTCTDSKTILIFDILFLFIGHSAPLVILT